MKFLTLLLVSILTSYSAVAAPKNGSEFLHQAGAGRFEITPLAGFASAKATAAEEQRPMTDTVITGTHFEVKGEYGINEMLAVGMTLGHSRTKSQPNPSSLYKSRTSKGVDDPEFFLNGTTPVGPGNLYFGTQFSFALTKDKIDADGNSNAASGGWTLTPYIGYDVAMGPGIFGVRFSYDFLQSNRKVVDKYMTPGSEESYTESGGQVLASDYFYEYPLSSTVTLAGSLDVRVQRTSDREQNGASTDQHDGVTTGQLNFYAPLHLSTNITLTPQLSYLHFIAHDTTVASSINGFAGQVAGRFSF